MNEFTKVDAPFGMNWLAVFVFFIVAALGGAVGQWLIKKTK